MARRVGDPAWGDPISLKIQQGLEKSYTLLMCMSPVWWLPVATEARSPSAKKGSSNTFKSTALRVSYSLRLRLVMAAMTFRQPLLSTFHGNGCLGLPLMFYLYIPHPNCPRWRQGQGARPALRALRFSYICPTPEARH
ncbi:MAG: hypothetical protein ACE14P_07055 [Methanotrichaceae archaeon]